MSQWLRAYIALTEDLVPFLALKAGDSQLPVTLDPMGNLLFSTGSGTYVLIHSQV